MVVAGAGAFRVENADPCVGLPAVESPHVPLAVGEFRGWVDGDGIARDLDPAVFDWDHGLGVIGEVFNDESTGFGFDGLVELEPKLAVGTAGGGAGCRGEAGDGGWGVRLG